MNSSPLTIIPAGPDDAETWLKLGYLAQDQPLPADLADQVKLFLSAPPAVADNRYICWLGGEPLACWQLHQLENIVELRDFFVVGDYVDSYGVRVLEQIVALARERGAFVTIDSYPATYSDMFLKAGFKQNIRTRMLKPLDTYQIQLVTLPAGVHLRHPQLADEPALSELIYKNYLGTVDQDMVSSNKAQAVAMVHSIFGHQYCCFDFDSSFLAVDEQQQLIGSIFLGDMSNHEMEQLMWVLDISINSAWRGKGLGKALLISGLNAARTKRYANIGLMVTMSNHNAIALYRSLGFREYGSPMYEAVLQLTQSVAS